LFQHSILIEFMTMVWLMYSSHKRMLYSRLDTLTVVLTKTEISWNVTPLITTFHKKKHPHFKIRNLILNF